MNIMNRFSPLGVDLRTKDGKEAVKIIGSASGVKSGYKKYWDRALLRIGVQRALNRDKNLHDLRVDFLRHCAKVKFITAEVNTSRKGAHRPTKDGKGWVILSRYAINNRYTEDPILIKILRKKYLGDAK